MLKAKERHKLSFEEGTFSWGFLNGYVNFGGITKEEAEQIKKEVNNTKHPLLSLMGHEKLAAINNKMLWKDEEER